MFEDDGAVRTIIGTLPIPTEQFDSLFTHGFCAFVVPKHVPGFTRHVPDFPRNSMKIGQVVEFLMDESDTGRRIMGRLVAHQETSDGKCVLIFAAAVSVYTPPKPPQGEVLAKVMLRGNKVTMEPVKKE